MTNAALCLLALPIRVNAYTHNWDTGEERFAYHIADFWCVAPWRRELPDRLKEAGCQDG